MKIKAKTRHAIRLPVTNPVPAPLTSSDISDLRRIQKTKENCTGFPRVARRRARGPPNFVIACSFLRSNAHAGDGSRRRASQQETRIIPQEQDHISAEVHGRSWLAPAGSRVMVGCHFEEICMSSYVGSDHPRLVQCPQRQCDCKLRAC